MSRTSIVIGIVLYLALTFLFIFNTVRGKGGFGINLDAFENGVICPRCGILHKGKRMPRNLRQALWGGKTCEKCGCEFDKWGKELDKA